MRFYSITSKKLKTLLIFLLVTVLANVFQAQNHAISPYSRFGVGDFQPIQTPRNVAMGGVSVGLTSPLSITSRNPATLRNLDSLMVNFEVTMHSIMSRLQENVSINGVDTTLSARSNRASLGQISFAFPITNWLGAGFGLTPATNMNYNVSREFGQSDTVIGRRILNHQGNGGLNQVFFGVGIGTDRISVGANFNYQFGMFTRNTFLHFVDTFLVIPAPGGAGWINAATTTENLTEVSVGGFFVDLGLQFRQPLNDRFALGLGLTYRPRYNLNATRNFTLRSNPGIGAEHIDIIAADTLDGRIQMPDMFTVGLSLERLGRWVIAGEYSFVDFSNYREFGRPDPNLGLSQTFRMGMEFMGQPLHSNFMNRLSYRFGAHHGTSYVAFHNNAITQQGITLGFGMPIARRGFGGGFARLDVAVEFGRKGNLNDGQIQENYARIVVGLSAFERWFVRGRFD